jgi:hypothetical protein
MEDLKNRVISILKEHLDTKDSLAEEIENTSGANIIGVNTMRMANESTLTLHLDSGENIFITVMVEK